MDALTYLTSISLLFLVGLLATLLAKKLKTSNVLLLVISGFLVEQLMNLVHPFMFPPLFVSITALIALSLIIFDGASRFKFKEFDTFSFYALKLFSVFLALNLLVLTPFVMWLFNMDLLSSLIFSSLGAATAFEVLSIVLKKTNNRCVEILNLESIINAPFTVLIPFLLIDFFKQNPTGIKYALTYINPFLQEIVSGIGAGVLIGVIIFKLMRNKYSSSLSPIALLTSVLLTYALAEQLKGSGVLAVTVLGLFFGNSYVKKKPALQEFSSAMSNSVEILIFLLFGMSINLPDSWIFFYKSLLVFAVYAVLRFLSVELALPYLNLKEKIFSTLVMPKGITIAAVALTISSVNSSFELVNNLLFLAFIYSLIVALITIHKSDWFLNKSLEKPVK